MNRTLVVLAVLFSLLTGAPVSLLTDEDSGSQEVELLK